MFAAKHPQIIEKQPVQTKISLAPEQKPETHAQTVSPEYIKWQQEKRQVELMVDILKSLAQESLTEIGKETGIQTEIEKTQPTAPEGLTAQELLSGEITAETITLAPELEKITVIRETKQKLSIFKSNLGHLEFSSTS